MPSTRSRPTAPTEGPAALRRRSGSFATEPAPSSIRGSRKRSSVALSEPWNLKTTPRKAVTGKGDDAHQQHDIPGNPELAGNRLPAPRRRLDRRRPADRRLARGDLAGAGEADRYPHVRWVPRGRHRASV